MARSCVKGLPSLLSWQQEFLILPIDWVFSFPPPCAVLQWSGRHTLDSQHSQNPEGIAPPAWLGWSPQPNSAAGITEIEKDGNLPWNAKLQTVEGTESLSMWPPHTRGNTI